nr:hypothetical protein [uncultured Rhodoferax sp.]
MIEPPKWSTNGANIMAPDQLATVRDHLDRVGPIAVLWWHYYGSRAPTPLAFGDFEVFMEFLGTEPQEGDAVDVWAFPSYDSPCIAEGKIPNALGQVPEGGAY